MAARRGYTALCCFGLLTTCQGSEAASLVQSFTQVHEHRAELSSEEEEGILRFASEYPVAGEMDWPFQCQGPVDVYVHWVPTVKRQFEPWVYHPAAFTIGQAFTDLGANVKWTHEPDVRRVLENTTKAVQMGRKPILVAIAFWSKHTTQNTKQFLAKFSEAGGFLVLYQSEVFPWVGVPHLEKVDQLVKDYSAKEIWDFSLANIEFFNNNSWKKVPIRYLPPGYVKELDFGINLDSPLRDEKRIAFMGRYSGRPKHIQEGYNRVIGDIFHEGWIESKTELIEYCTKYPLQLNLHHAQDCCPSTNPVEAFRFAQLIANKACVISAMSYQLEAKDWIGIVHFIDINDTRKEIQNLQKDLKRCQMESYNLYKQRFAPLQLLRNSGFDEVFKKMTPYLNH